jgi:multidrug resistance efflux pump
MRKGLTIGLLALAALPAQAEIFKCSDPSGHVTYSNVASKGCARLNLDPISTVPATKAAPKTPTPSTFPRVEESTQKSRDTDRRKILEQERATEQKSLDEARKKLAEAEQPLPQERNPGGAVNQGKVQERIQPMLDQVQLHMRNLEAINKELQNLR